MTVTDKPWQQFGADGEGAMGRNLGLDYVEASSNRVVIRMPVEPNTQPYGLLHGGASCALAETAASIGASLWAGPDRIALGFELNATHLRSASSGYVTAVASLARGGRTVATYNVEIHDDQDRLICTARVTCVIRERR